jgi:hypothetical protein
LAEELDLIQQIVDGRALHAGTVPPNIYK